MTLVSLSALLSCQGAKPASSPTCSNREEGDLVITELLVDPPGTDTGKEYIELYNATDAEMDLQGLTLYLSKPDASDEKTHIFKSLKVPARGYVALGDTRTDLASSEVSYSYGNSLGALPNSEGVVGLRCGKVLIDEVRYSGSSAGKALVLSGQTAPDAQSNDLPTSWCDARTEFIQGTFGSPGKANDSCGAGGNCLDANGVSRLAVVPAPNSLLFSEFLANPKGVDTDKEWIELHALSDVDLNGLTLKVGSSSTLLTSPNCLRVAAGSEVVLARSSQADLNGGMTQVLATFTGTLPNSNGTLVLENGGTMLDSVKYGATTEGISTQLSRDKRDPISNDDPASFCASSMPYGDGTNKGTPGLPNDACPTLIAAGDCLDDVTGQSRPIVRPLEGDLVITEIHANPSGSDTGKEWFEVYVKNPVDLNGMILANEGTGRSTLDATRCLRVAADTHLVFATQADSSLNGGLPDTLAGLYNFPLANTGARALQLRTDAGLIDSVGYGSTDAGVLLPAEGVSLQLDPQMRDHQLNDSFSAWCKTPADAGTYGSGDLGTPGAPNVGCPP